MIERALIALALIVALAVLIEGTRRWLRHRDARTLRRLRGTPAAPGASAAPRILYFTTSTCVVCRTQQEPAIERLRQRIPDLILDQRDAVQEQGLASEYGVRSVPTTAVYGRDGHLVRINRGPASTDTLAAQIEGDEHTLAGQPQ